MDKSRRNENSLTKTAALAHSNSLTSSRSEDVRLNGHLVGKGVHSATVSASDETVAVVTGFSENHFTESVDMIASIQRYSPTSPIIVYDLGISGSSLKTVW